MVVRFWSRISDTDTSIGSAVSNTCLITLCDFQVTTASDTISICIEKSYVIAAIYPHAFQQMPIVDLKHICCWVKLKGTLNF